ncbi:alkaline phosphatase family protein [Saccharopolyspora rhizosphaerae]|uniref:Alkaline phosphatase family protein n=1 Tax=Saccharopolyspora rhizosphaerae TaxID=2492662 RepID=A0A3R8P4W5_9PSEU|nr:alkaline phosphatase family protein [Saccharopolyspora rhizosphaerae]RRO16638.1 alkaline phosphatase family protein [Saccharopolyspora rhizosphaerae]
MRPLDRRSFLRAAGAGVLLSAASPVAWAAEDKDLRAYVLVVDGCRPEEITLLLTPRLHELRTSGTAFPAARSLPVVETIPNHVMMMSGTRPDRTGVPANSVFDRAEGSVRTLDRPSDLRGETLLDGLRAHGGVTGSVLSKQYLHGIFGTRATVRWEPEPIVPISGHAPDAFTAEAMVSVVDSADPELVFANFGDVDRVGHTDLTGTTLRAARTAALASADAQVGRLVDHLRSTGRWDSTVLLVLADHSMDWSLPHQVVSLRPVFETDPALAGRTEVAQNGGAELLYFTGPDADRPAAVRRMRELAVATDGVQSVHDPAELRLGPEAGDLLAYCAPGWRFTDPNLTSNPIPGNHGHPVTEPIPFFLSGGHPRVRRNHESPAPATTTDVAPTIAALFGLPTDHYDGTPRTEAFT